jgi:hypothetical protein
VGFLLAIVALPDDGGHKSVSPLLRQQVDLAIEFTHGDRFGINNLLLKLIILPANFRILLNNASHRLLQHPINGRLAHARLPHNHHPKPNPQNLMQLHNLNRQLSLPPKFIVFDHV